MEEFIKRETLESWVRSEVASLDTEADREFVIQRWRKEIPTADVALIVRCENCQYYNEDYFQMIEGVPVIIAHHVCSFWGRGCATNPDGFCYKGKRKENTV